MRKLWLAMALAVAVAAAGCGGAQQKGPAGGVGATQPGQQVQVQPAAPATAKKQWSKAPDMQIDTSKQYFATIKTNLGDIKIELFAKESPKTVNNFVFLAREHFYDGVIFHRIIKGFMVQTGDPQGTGGGGPGYKFADELPPKHSYDLGIVAMANAGANTNGSQFFICNGAGAKSLNEMPNYTQFGKVVAGLDVLEKISSVEVVTNPSNPREKSKPVNPPVIQSVVVEEK
jgi:cyclophilin family peptidyl-prolyl cis-trans isomerase